jgi:acyl dehydratase
MKCFEDFAVGDMIVLGQKTVTAADIAAFAAEFHADPAHLADAGSSSAFQVLREVAEPGAPPAEALQPIKGPVASGWHVGAMFMRTFYDGLLAQSSSRGSPGIESLDWLHPVQADDTIRFSLEVMDIKASRSRPDMGLVLFDMIGLNQRGETVLSGRSWTMFGRREADHVVV